MPELTKERSRELIDRLILSVTYDFSEQLMKSLCRDSKREDWNDIAKRIALEVAEFLSNNKIHNNCKYMEEWKTLFKD